MSAHPLPVVGGQVSDLVLRDELLQDLRNILKVGFVLIKLHPVDQRCQLVHLLPRTLVVTSQILRQLLQRKTQSQFIFYFLDFFKNCADVSESCYSLGSSGRWSRPWSLFPARCWSTASSWRTPDTSVKALHLHNKDTEVTRYNRNENL